MTDKKSVRHILRRLSALFAYSSCLLYVLNVLSLGF
jgi:hypothetical protein